MARSSGATATAAAPPPSDAAQRPRTLKRPRKASGKGKRDATDDLALVAGRPQGVQLRARRNPRLMALGILLACLGGLGAALLWQGISHSASVLVVARPVAAGQIVNAADITTTTMGSAPGVGSVPASQLASVIGRTALVDLTPGALLAPGQTGQLLLPTTDTRVGVKLDAGRAPTAGLAPGTHVQLVPVTGSANDPVPSGAPVEAIVATEPRTSDTGEAMLFDLGVAPGDATRVAQLAARQQLAVVREGQK